MRIRGLGLALEGEGPKLTRVLQFGQGGARSSRQFYDSEKVGGPNSPQFYNLDKVALRRTDPLRHFAHVEGQKHTRIARSTLTNHHKGSPRAKWNREKRRE